LTTTAVVTLVTHASVDRLLAGVMPAGPDTRTPAGSARTFCTSTRASAMLSAP
jgi:hypothetical protein